MHEQGTALLLIFGCFSMSGGWLALARRSVESLLILLCLLPLPVLCLTEPTAAGRAREGFPFCCLELLSLLDEDGASMTTILSSALSLLLPALFLLKAVSSPLRLKLGALPGFEPTFCAYCA